MKVDLPEELYFYLSPPHPCSYLSDREQTTVLADPKFQMSMDIFDSLSEVGFRRSGGIVYTPRCRECSACLPVRVPINEFSPNRSQRRNWKQNQDLHVSVKDAVIHEEHFELYRRYIHHRHGDGEMATDDPERFAEFFLSKWCDSRFIEFRLGEQPNDKLIAMAVIDLLESGWSAVYTFFDPDYSKRGLGTFAVLWMLEQCKQLDHSYLYLGYLIHESPKMSYKAKFKPYEVFSDGIWQLETPQ